MLTGSWGQRWHRAVTRAHCMPGLVHPLPVSSHSPPCKEVLVSPSCRGETEAGEVKSLSRCGAESTKGAVGL